MVEIGGNCWKAMTLDGHVVSIYDTIMGYVPVIGQVAAQELGCWAVGGAIEVIDNIAHGHVMLGNQVRNQVQTLCSINGFVCTEDELVLPDLPGYGPVNLVVQRRAEQVQIEFVQTQAFDIRKRGSGNSCGYLAVISGEGHMLMNIFRKDGGIGVCTRVNPPGEHWVTLCMQDRVNPPFINHDLDRLHLDCNIEFSDDTVGKIVGVLNSWK